MLDSAPAPPESPAPGPLASHRVILTGAALLAAATVVVKLAAFAKDWLVAWRFGASDELDAYLIGVLIPSFAVGVLVHSLAAGFMPTYIRVFETHGGAAAARLVASLLAAGSALLVAVTLVLLGTARSILPWLGLGFPPEKLALAESLFYVTSGILIITGLSAVFAAVLNAHERFRMTALAPLAVPSVTFGVLWAFQQRLGIYALAVGTVAGFAAECCLLAGAIWRGGWWQWPRWHGLDDNLRHFLSQYLAVALAALLASSSLVVDQSMAASLSGNNVSVLTYGNKIVALVLAIVAVSLSTVLFPRLSRMILAGAWGELDRTIRNYSLAVLIVGVPVVGILAVASAPLVRLLFERGSFTAEMTRAVSQVQLWYLPQLPFAVLVMLGYRVLASLDGNRAVLAIGMLNLALSVTGNVVLMHWFGVRGIAMSTSITSVVALAVTYAAIRWKLADARRRSG